MNDSILTMPQPAARPLFPKLHIDLPLFTGLLLLCAFGIAVLYSAGGNDLGLVKRQLLHLGLAFVILGFIAWYVMLLGRSEGALLQARRAREASRHTSAASGRRN